MMDARQVRFWIARGAPGLFLAGETDRFSIFFAASTRQAAEVGFVHPARKIDLFADFLSSLFVYLRGLSRASRPKNRK